MDRRDSHSIVTSIKKYFRWGYDLCTRSVSADSSAQRNLSASKDQQDSRSLLTRKINSQHEHSHGPAQTQVKLQHDLERFDCVMRLLVGNLSSDGSTLLMGDYATYIKVIYSFFKDTSKARLDIDTCSRYGIEDVAKLVMEEVTSLFQKNQLLIDAINKRFVHALVMFKSWLTALDAQYPSDRRYIAATLIKILDVHQKLFVTFRFRNQFVDRLEKLTQSTTTNTSQGSEIVEVLGLDPFDSSVEPLMDQCTSYIAEMYQSRGTVEDSQIQSMQSQIEAIEKSLMDESERSSVHEWIGAYCVNVKQMRLFNFAVSEMDDEVILEIIGVIQETLMEYVLAFSSKAAAARSRKDEDFYVRMLSMMAVMMLDLKAATEKLNLVHA
jgi:hypothetical protein